MLDNPGEVLTSMAGSFGYAAPEVMMRQGHGMAVDLWSLGVITYTLLCGYSPFRSENVQDLIEETGSGQVVFHERYWRDVSEDARNFILSLLQPDPAKRPTSEQALQHRWLKGETASDRDLLPELKAYMAKARLRRGIELVKLANRVEALRMQEDDEDLPSREETPSAKSHAEKATSHTENKSHTAGRISRAARSAIFREVVLAKVRELRATEQAEKVEREAKARAGV